MEKTIYQIRNKINGKLYIGSTKNFKQRKSCHIKEMNSCKSRCYAIQNAWNKYGKEAFEFEIIDYVADDLDMVWIEEEYTILFNTINNGYNIQLPYTRQGKNEKSYDKTTYGVKEWFKTNAPNGLKKMTPEEWIQKRNEDPNFKIWTKIPKEDWKQAVHINSKSVVSVDITGSIINEYRSVFQAQKEYGNPDNASIRACCKVNNKYIKAYKRYNLYWYFKEDFDKDKFLKLFVRPIKIKTIKPTSERNIRRIPIAIQNIITGEILNFKSISECAKFLDSKDSSIHELKRGFKNKGGGKITKVLSYKGYRYINP